MNFELIWRFEALKTAAMEQLQYSDALDLEKLFERGRQIYDKGYEFEMHKWHNDWLEAEKDEETTEEKEEMIVNKAVRQGYKNCPRCSEEVKESWKEHKYRKDMTPCGYKWD